MGILILAVTLVFLYSFFICRSTLALRVDLKLKKRQRKRVTFKQTFVEWLLCKRYFGVLSKFYIVWYYSIFVQFVIGIVLVIVLHSTSHIVNHIPLDILLINTIIAAPTRFQHRVEKRR